MSDFTKQIFTAKLAFDWWTKHKLLVLNINLIRFTTQPAKCVKLLTHPLKFVLKKKLISLCLLYFLEPNNSTESKSKLKCPADKPETKCLTNPCGTATCQAFPTAICKPNYCGGCNAEFFLGGAKINCGRLNLFVLFLIYLEWRSSVYLSEINRLLLSTEVILWLTVKNVMNWVQPPFSQSHFHGNRSNLFLNMQGLIKVPFTVNRFCCLCSQSRLIKFQRSCNFDFETTVLDNSAQEMPKVDLVSNVPKSICYGALQFKGWKYGRERLPTNVKEENFMAFKVGKESTLI